jgi:hypothetical protein
MVSAPLAPSREADMPGTIRSSESKPKDEATVVWKAISRLAQRWDLKQRDLAKILGVDPGTITRWSQHTEIPSKDRRLRESLQSLLAVHRSLGALFVNLDDQRQWLQTEHPVLREAPLAMMRRSLEGMITLRQYLDYVRGQGA